MLTSEPFHFGADCKGPAAHRGRTEAGPAGKVRRGLKTGLTSLGLLLCSTVAMFAQDQLPNIVLIGAGGLGYADNHP